MQVGAGHARTVLLLRPEGEDEEADAQQAATVAALKTAGGASARQTLVLQSTAEEDGSGGVVGGSGALTAALHAVALPKGKAAIVSTSGTKRMSELMAQVGTREE